MDLLDRIQYQNYDLNIEIGDIEYGWMDITLVSNYAFKKYEASYICDPINDLIEKFVLLIDDKPFQINPFQSRLNLAFIEHDCEGQNIVWLLRKIEDDLYIYIWENEYDIEEWLLADFSSKHYTDNYDEVPSITKNLVFSLKGKMKDFAETLTKTIDQLKSKASEFDMSEKWGYKLSESNYQKLKKYLSLPVKTQNRG